MLAIAIGSFALGGATGAGIYHAAVVDRAPPQVAQIAAPRAPELPARVEEPPPAVAPPEPIAEPESQAPPLPRPANEASPRSDLAREGAMIDAARAAIARGNVASALEAIERHAREFPRGAMTEDRESLRVIALARAGRTEEAERAAERFRRRYPRSFLLPAIESALGDR